LEELSEILGSIDKLSFCIFLFQFVILLLSSFHSSVLRCKLLDFFDNELFLDFTKLLLSSCFFINHSTSTVHNLSEISFFTSFLGLVYFLLEIAFNLATTSSG
jgi:hypothetical protein